MRLQLTVSKPCHEDWASMSERTNGRFCESCQHEVADLTHATDGELLRLFGGTGEPPKCARFDPRQLDRVLRTTEERTSGLLPIAAFTSLLALLSGTEALGQQRATVGKPMPERGQRMHVPSGTADVARTRTAGPRTITIRGRLVNASTGLAVTDGFVSLWGGTQVIQRYSETSGQFTITFEAVADSAELFFGGHDREPFTQFVSWAGATHNDPITIDMDEVRITQMPRIEPREMMLGEVAVQRRPTWRLFGNKP